MGSIPVKLSPTTPGVDSTGQIPFKLTKGTTPTTLLRKLAQAAK